MNCLMIKTNDNRKFLIKKQNIFNVLEFINTFNAELFSVSVSKSENIIDLKDFAYHFCNKDGKYNPKIKSIRKINLEKKSNTIQYYIKKTFLENKQISLKELYSKYNSISKSSINNYFKKIKSNLISNGYIISKAKAGVYCIHQ